MLPVILQYVCLTGLAVLGTLTVVVWLHEREIDPLKLIDRFFRQFPWPIRILIGCFVCSLIGHGSSKGPTNPPPLGMSAPRRTSQIPTDAPWHVGTNETWNFDRPAWAAEVAPWMRRGASDDWMPAGPLGVLMARGRVLTDDETFDLHERPLALVPASRSVGTNRPSRVWYGLAPWGSTVYTWQNAYADRDTNALVSAQLERLPNGDRIYRYGEGAPVTSRAYAAPRPADADSDGDGIPDSLDAAPMDPDADGDGIADGMTRLAYENHPLWRSNSPDGEPVNVRLNEPVVPPAKALLQFGTLRIVLTTNAVYRLSLQPGTKVSVKLTTNGFQPVNLTTERGEE